MTRTIAVIDGHPDPDRGRFCHALADACAEGAAEAGHIVERISIADLDIPMLRTAADWTGAPPTEAIRHCQEAIGRAEHLVIVYPLWLGSMPALLKAFMEQVFRPGFAVREGERGLRSGLLTGKSARIVVTMGMPALVYRWFFLAHSLRSLERNILRFSGIGPIRETLIGSIDAIGPEKRAAWLERLTELGRRGR